MAARTSKPLTISKTVAPPGGPQRAAFRTPERPASRRPWGVTESLDEHPGERRDRVAGRVARADSPRHCRLQDLAREWMLDLQVLGRSQRTLDWLKGGKSRSEFRPRDRTRSADRPVPVAW